MKGHDPVTDLIGSVLAFSGIISIIVLFAIGGLVPLMVFSIMRSMKAIRRELSTLNETLQNKLIIR